MTRAEEEEILDKFNPDWRSLNAFELSELITKKVKHKEQEIFTKAFRNKAPRIHEAEEYVRVGRIGKALEVLNYALSRGHYGNEAVYGLLGDVYLKKGDKEKAIEMYKKSGSIDSLKILRRIE
ncbi:MAG: hypothetical protein ACE5J5_05440 [Candidatus Hydrothermarchaeales archaeon]